MNPLKISLLLISSVIFFPAKAQEQKVVNQTNSIKLLQVRPYYLFGVDPTNEFMSQLNLDAQFWYEQKADLRFGFMSGNITGITLGGTMHKKDKGVSMDHKFIVSQSESRGVRTTEYYKKQAQVRRVVGPTADLKVAFLNFEKLKTQNPFFEVSGGLDFQTFSRNYLDVGSETYNSNKNGWFSVKGLGIIQYYKTTESYLRFGAMGSMNAVRRPWKGVSMNLRCDLGATFGKGGVIPIISPGFGLSVNLLNSKKPIEY